MINEKPNLKPKNPNFSSGPTAKRPGWSISNLQNAILGRSHRSSGAKAKLQKVIEMSKDILDLPKDYCLGIMPGSDTGALEASLWSLLGARGVDILAWESFGKDWVTDVVEQLKIDDVNIYEADYGQLPDLNSIDFNRDVIFTWNGTTSGIKVPNGDWIDSDRKGLTICDATSAIFAMKIDYNKCDVITWSWQKVLGGEAAHGMLALSPNAVKRLEQHQPIWPIPKGFRLANKKKFISGIFSGNTINTPSMLCVEDALDSLEWIKSIGGLSKLIERSQNSFTHISNWISKTSCFEFLNSDEKICSNTSVTFRISAEWFNRLELEKQKEVMKKITKLLEEENIAYDINGYTKAPPSFRVWAGGTVDPKDVSLLLPWIEWAYNIIQIDYNI